MIPAIVASGASPIVRVPAPENAYVKRALDAGAHGIMFPMIETPEQAAAAVRYCKFPPQGMRGVGSPFAPTYFGQSMTAYQDSANEATMVLVQIETPLGLKNAFNIASVPGIGANRSYHRQAVDNDLMVDAVDMLFIGPNDLACSLGNGSTPHMQVCRYNDCVLLRKAGSSYRVFLPGLGNTTRYRPRRRPSNRSEKRPSVQASSVAYSVSVQSRQLRASSKVSN